MADESLMKPGLRLEMTKFKKKDKYDERNDKTMIMKMTAGKKW